MQWDTETQFLPSGLGKNCQPGGKPEETHGFVEWKWLKYGTWSSEQEWHTTCLAVME